MHPAPRLAYPLALATPRLTPDLQGHEKMPPPKKKRAKRRMPTKQEAKKKNFCAVLMQRLLRALADVRPLVRAGGCAVRPCAGPSCAAAGTGNGATAIVRGLLELFLLSFLLTPVFSEAVPFVADNHLHRIFGHARLPFEACQSEAPINGRLAGIGPHAQACDGLCLLTRKVMGLQKTHTHKPFALSSSAPKSEEL